MVNIFRNKNFKIVLVDFYIPIICFYWHSNCFNSCIRSQELPRKFFLTVGQTNIKQIYSKNLELERHKMIKKMGKILETLHDEHDPLCTKFFRFSNTYSGPLKYQFLEPKNK